MLRIIPKLLRFKRIHEARRWAEGMWPFISATLTGKRKKQLRSINQKIKISESSGIDEFYSLDVNGSQQWIRIRGRKINNPILVYLHGGPGGSSLPIYSLGLHNWEHHFTVVQWEQRGAGKSYSSNVDPATMNLTQLIDDTFVVVRHVLTKFSKDKVCLLGHSWGSFLGIHTLLRSSDFIGAYVGTGQVVDMMKAEALGYEFALQKARDDSNEIAVKQLGEILPYPTSMSGDHHKRPIARHWARHYGWQGSAETSLNRTALMTTPEYSLFSIYRYLKGSLFSLRLASQLVDPSLQPSIIRKKFDIPMYFLSGKTDAYTPTSLVDEYFLSLSAPVKEHIVFENSGHWPMLTEYDDYLTVLVDKVRPHIS